MKHLRRIGLFGMGILFAAAVSGSARAGEVFKPAFAGDTPGAEWGHSGGTFGVVDQALTIRSGESNPTIYLKDKNWNHARITFTLTRRGGGSFIVYAGWRYPEYVRFTLNPAAKGDLRVVSAPGGEESAFPYADKVEAAAPLKFEITVSGVVASCRINGVDVAAYEAKSPLRGSIAFGGTWGSDFEIRDLAVETLPAPPDEKKK